MLELGQKYAFREQKIEDQLDGSLHTMDSVGEVGLAYVDLGRKDARIESRLRR